MSTKRELFLSLSMFTFIIKRKEKMKSKEKEDFLYLNYKLTIKKIVFSTSLQKMRKIMCSVPAWFCIVEKWQQKLNLFLILIHILILKHILMEFLQCDCGLKEQWFIISHASFARIVPLAWPIENTSDRFYCTDVIFLK